MRAGGKGASPGNLSLLFPIVKVVALVLFRSQDVPVTFDKPGLMEKLSLELYRQLHVVSQDWRLCGFVKEKGFIIFYESAPFRLI